MRVLIGTPIHQVKDYCMERWLQSVADLLKVSDADFLIVDNSSGLSYVEKVKEYLKKYGIEKYQIKHINFKQGMSLLDKCERIEATQKFIRQYVLTHNYDAWFSWECDQIIPKNGLNELIKVMEAGNFMVVAHNSWTRGSSVLYNMDMGVTLINRESLEKHHWQGGGEETLFKERVYKGGGSYANVYGLLKPVYHLDDKHYLDENN
jgi:hypothetical protein